MNMLKRSLAMLLVLTMLFSFVPFSVFADDGESVETTAVTEAVEQRSGGPGNSDFGHSQGNGKDKHKDPLKETEAPEVTEAPTETTVPETTVPETTVPETTVPETTVPETTVPETTVPETTVPETTVPETTVPETTVPETTVPETTVPETTVPETEPLIRCMLSDAELNVASTDGVYTGTVEAPDEFLKVFHLDVGRKYFTVDQVKGILDILGEKGYSHMELAIGNDGLRFLLDDMSVTVGETTYDSATVTAGVKAGNNTYSHAGEWSEDDMEAILAYAKTKGIEIIPLVNTPGHMDAILDAMEDCGISDVAFNDSARTVDLTNEAAVAFTQELVGKYMAYFASKGCNYFNIGADEYANDVSNGWSDLISNKTYYLFVDYINDLVAMACGYGMRPIAFNDGIYYNKNTSYGTFDTRLIISYWSSGWGGYNLAPASFLQEKNHLILNTTDMWYYVLGDASSAYSYNYALSRTQNTPVTSVIGAIGAMQCVWCDNPAKPYNENEQTRISTLISTLAAKNPTYFTGPNVVEPEEPEETEPTTPSEPTTPVEPAPVVDDATKVSVTAQNVTKIEVAPVKENVPTVEGASAVVAFEMTPKTEDGTAYTGKATVSIPVSADWTNVRGGVQASAHGDEVMGIEGDLKTDAQGNKTFTFTVPHFSTVVAYELDSRATNEKTIEVYIGQTVTDTITGANYAENVDKSNLDETKATVSATYVTNEAESYWELVTNGAAGIEDGAQYIIANATTSIRALSKTGGRSGNGDITVSNGRITSNVDAQCIFTFEKNGDGWNLKDSDGKYLYPTAVYETGWFGSGSWEYSLSTQQNTAQAVTISGANSVTISRSVTSGNRNTTAYIRHNSGYSSSNSIGNLYLFKKVDIPAADDTIVSFTGVGAGTTTVTVGDTTYNIVVKKLELSDTITVGDSKVYTDNSTNVTVDNESIVAATPDGNGKLTITAKAAGTATVTTDNAVYNITVVEFDPATVTPLTVEYWITNIVTRTVESTTENPVTTQQISAAAAGVATAEGADINAMMPEWTIKKDGDSGEDRQVEFWHVRLLDKNQTNNSSSGTEEQTTQSADDETTNGDAVTRVRYYDPGDGNGRRWQMLSGSTWLDVTRNNQIVAYYMEVVDIQNANGTTELHVNAADWGKLGDNSPASSYADTSKYCSISLQIVYEDGSGNPATTTAADLDSKTLIFNYWDNGRGIGTFAFDTLGQFNIYQITAETGAVNVTFTGGAWGTAQVNNFSWDDNEKVVWSGESETASIYNNTSHPSNADPKDNLMWNENKEAILIRVYVKAVKTEDSLNVVYIDEKFNDTLYSYHIQVPTGKNFTNGMIGKPGAMENGRINVTGCGIENVYGQTQYFQTDLTKVPEAKGKYNSELYTYTGSKISDDGKTLYLYYNINTTVLKPNFVVDFGLPITFPLGDLLGEGTQTTEVTNVSGLSANYGTLTYNNGTFTYTPNKILRNIDILSITLTIDGKAATTNVGVTPATTVYYEESFLTYDSNWDGGTTAPTKTQKTEVLGHSTYYGYDTAYAGDKIGSNGTQAVSRVNGATASFTFTGTGFELYANSKLASGIVTVYSEGNVSKLYMIDTALTDGESDATDNHTGATTHYSLPIISENSLPHGTYTVQLRQTNGSEYIYIDGVRIINTIKDSSIYKDDLEDNPEFYELRDYVLNALNVDNNTSVDYGNLEQMKNQVYADISNNGEAPANAAVVLSNDAAIDAQDLLDNGPKNELYLYPGSSLTFKFTTNRVAQLGLKSPTGSVNFTLNGESKSIGTTVDMFYKIAEQGTASNGKTVTIAVPADATGVLSVTDLKICDDPNAALLPLTLADIENTLVNVYGFSNEETPVEPPAPETPTEPSKPVEPTEPEKPTEPEVEETKPTKPGKPEKPEKPAKPGQNKPGKPAEKQKDAKLKITYVNLLGKKVGSATLTKTGTANQRCTFSASEIIGNAPARRNALWFLPVVSAYGSNVSIIVPVI